MKFHNHYCPFLFCFFAQETESHGEQEIIKSSIRELQQTQQSKDLLKKGEKNTPTHST